MPLRFETLYQPNEYHGFVMREPARTKNDESAAELPRGFLLQKIGLTLKPCYTVPVANLTITVDDEVLKRARIRAIEQGTSVNAILSEHLARFAHVRNVQEEAISNLLELARRRTKADRERARRRGGRQWSRDELYDR